MASIYKLRIHRWAKGKTLNAIAVMQAQQLACLAEGVHDLLLKLRQRKIDGHLPARPPVAVWLALYQDHRRVMLGTADQMPEIVGTGDELVELLDGSQALSVYAKNRPHRVKRWLRRIGGPRIIRWLRIGFRLVGRQYKQHLRQIQADLKQQAGGAADDLEAMLQRSPELYYFARVVLPCVVVYRRLPAMLLRRARLGDAQAIEQLVRVDDLAVHHATIQAWANEQPGAIRQERQRLLRQWAEQGLDHGQFNRRQVKVSLAGLISAYAQTLGHLLVLRTGQVIPAKLTA
ncbi:MAG: hypothetical protein WD534_02320 [Phycisphaeraceae bacterium]